MQELLVRWSQLSFIPFLFKYINCWFHFCVLVDKLILAHHWFLCVIKIDELRLNFEMSGTSPAAGAGVSKETFGIREERFGASRVGVKRKRALHKIRGYPAVIHQYGDDLPAR